MPIIDIYQSISRPELVNTKSIILQQLRDVESNIQKSESKGRDKALLKLRAKLRDELEVIETQLDDIDNSDGRVALMEKMKGAGDKFLRGTVPRSLGKQQNEHRSSRPPLPTAKSAPGSPSGLTIGHFARAIRKSISPESFHAVNN